MALQPSHGRSGNLRRGVPLPYAPVPDGIPCDGDGATRLDGVAQDPSRPRDHALQRTTGGFFVKARDRFRR